MFWVDSELGSDIYLDGKCKLIFLCIGISYLDLEQCIIGVLRQGLRTCLKCMNLVFTLADFITEVSLLILMLVYLLGKVLSLAKASKSYLMLF